MALSVLMSVFPRPKIPDYWSTEAIYYSPVYTSVMSRNRFQLITKLLHFADNTFWNPKYKNHDKLYKIRSALDYLGTRFQEVYVPTKNVRIEEQLLLHKAGNLPSKRPRHNIKFFSLRDETGYLYKTECYAGKNAAVGENVTDAEENHRPLGKSEQVVLRLMESLLGKGHHLYVGKRYKNLLVQLFLVL